MKGYDVGPSRKAGIQLVAQLEYVAENRVHECVQRHLIDRRRYRLGTEA
jgi:hypothetical protein